MLLIDQHGVISYANAAAAYLVGANVTSVCGMSVLTLVHPEDKQHVIDCLAQVGGNSVGFEVNEYRVRAPDGSWRSVAVKASNLSDISPTAGVLVTANDVTEERAHQRALQKLAMTNPTTGLPNRLALRERLAHEMVKDGPVAVAFVDLDHFQRVNDCFGHAVGDIVLSACANRLVSLVPSDSMVAHFSSDTFVLVVSGLQLARAVELVWESIGHLASPLYSSGYELRLTASAGIAMREVASTPESLIRDADAALTRAKTHQRGGVETFTEAMRAESVERMALETELRHALERHELSLHFQPIVGLADRRPRASEALARWTRRTGQEVSPVTFVPLAEDTGLIVPIGEWLIRGATRAVQHGLVERVSVNLSPRQLLDPSLTARVERLLRLRGVRPDHLAFEVTETVVVENYRLASYALSRLRELGCRVGVDDFGTGYSSLGCLRQLPLDFLKLDRELVTDVDTDARAAQIADTIIALAHSLSLTTVAEGVERESQADVLAGMGCDYGQGWFFGYPSAL